MRRDCPQRQVSQDFGIAQSQLAVGQEWIQFIPPHQHYYKEKVGRKQKAKTGSRKEHGRMNSGKSCEQCCRMNSAHRNLISQVPFSLYFQLFFPSGL